MRRILTTLLFAGLVTAWAQPAFSQAKRTDVIWARQTPNPITLDGVLNEGDWAKAESLVVRFGKEGGIPGSGWKIEAGILPSDSTYAVLKLLVRDNQMYLGAEVKDNSVGGSKDFNRFDGFLMSIKDHLNGSSPKPPDEYLYSWWSPDPQPPLPPLPPPAPGDPPTFLGEFGNFDRTPRTPAQIAAWDAVTVVHGLSHNDSVVDTGYTVEMRFDLGIEGYDTARAQGDIVEWNISIYDCDAFWPIDFFKFSSFRTWLQSPWGNVGWYNELRVYSKPSVTTNSGPAPYVGPEVVIPSGASYATPTIDGSLTEPIWAALGHTQIKYGDDPLRQTYPAVGPARSGQYQPPVNGGQAFIIDPADADFKVFVKDDKLYMGFDVRDQFVQYHSVSDRFDGFIVSINDRVARTPDNTLMGRKLTFQVGPGGAAAPLDYLLSMVTAGTATVAIHLNTGTTVDTVGLAPDNGYTAELVVDLTALGYPAGLGDRALFLGVDLLDGDSLTPYTDSYGTRTWWFREVESMCCPAVAYLSNAPVTGVGEDPTPKPPVGYQLLGAYPNPAVFQTLRYSLDQASHIDLDVFDVSGRLVESRSLGLQAAGIRELTFDAHALADGLYLYRIKVTDPADGSLRAELPGRIIVRH